MWRTAYGKVLAGWQRDIVRALFEVYPAGHPKAGVLRYQSAFLSVPRQNGKSELSAAVSLMALLMQRDALVIGIASSVEQANVIYDRVRNAVNRTPELSRMLKATGTRGIRGDGRSYAVKPSKDASLQGLAISFGIVDECHLLPLNLWGALTSGTGGRDNAIVFGVTTAGTQKSELLNHLYERAAKAFEDPDTRLGAWIFEAEDDTVPADDTALLEKLRTCNPILHAGLVDPVAFTSMVRGHPDEHIVQFHFNRFVKKGASDDLFPGAKWAALATRAEWPAGPLWAAVEAPANLDFATVAVAAKDGDVTRTELAAWFTQPTVREIADACARLNRGHRCEGFVVDSRNGKALAEELRRRGLRVIEAHIADVLAADSGLYSKVMRDAIRHGGDALLAMQIAGATRKSYGTDGWRIAVRKGSRFGIDAVRATAQAAWAAETQRPRGSVIR
ncbi:terminase large subunit domain-containing protein [Gryllotalpicola daejeonensis]|uniref:terminase large subunit domain-containing protein n=1 Tax=Gryllotalpicola daejeonensis TaxID=993087 RepID=UPI0031CF7FE4